MEKRKHCSRGHGNQNGQKEKNLPGQGVLHLIDKQDTAKASHKHNTLKGDINYTASFGEHPAQGYNHQRNGKKHGLLNQKINSIHNLSPAFL